MGEVDDAWREVVAHFPGNRSKKAGGFGSRTLMSGGRIVAMLAQQTLVLRLSQARVSALIGSREGKAWGPSAGRVLKEWVAIPTVDVKRWRQLVREAIGPPVEPAVRKQPTRRRRTTHR